jgi:hypothetical protein
MYLRFLDMYFYFLSALVRHTIYIYIHTDFGWVIVTCDDVFLMLCVYSVQFVILCMNLHDT